MAKLDYFQDSGSNYDFHDKKIPPNLQRSLFDLSYVNTLTAKQGQLIPVWFSYTYPGDEFDVSIDNLIRVVNPPVVPLMSRQRVFFHLFKVDFSQLWTHWEQFMKRGWSGDYEGLIPRIAFMPYYLGDSNSKITSEYALRGQLPDYLGFNFGNFTDGDIGVNTYLPAMPFLAYQLIYRDYFLNMPIAYEVFKNNELAGFMAFFPDSEYDLMIQGESPVYDYALSSEQNLSTFGPIGRVDLMQLRYRDFAPDYFTTALPYIMKGNTPTTTLDVSGAAGSAAGVPLTWSDGTQAVFENFILRYTDDNVTSTPIWEGLNFDGTSAFSVNIGNGTSFNYGSKNVVSAANMPSNKQSDLRLRLNDLQNFAEFGLTQLQLRQLWTDTLILEKMTRTDGSYGQFVNSFFGTNPSHWVNHRPTYVGGSYQPIVFTEVLQSTPSAEGGTLGTVGGKGISSSSSHLGSFSCTDFGCAMVIMSIMPDTYYSQGQMREHLYLTQADYPLPERALLGPQPVYTAELYATPGSLLTKSLFGYQSRFDELRYRQNEVHGDVADLDNASFSPYVQQRKFNTSPSLNLTFLTTQNNVDNSWLSAPEEPAYLVQVANRVTCKRSLPYIAPPTAVLG